MFLKVPVSASPFPISNIRIEEPSFKNNLIFGTVNKGSSENSGGGSSYNFTGALYSSMGEYLERLTQSKPSHRLKYEYLNAYNISKDKIEKIPLEKVLLFDPRVFDTDIDFNWNDSSGTAFHTNSIELIESSFFEFIERQSLVYNWLTKTPGKKINLEEFFHNDKIRNLSKTMKAYFDSFNLFEISIHPKCNVVISIGIQENRKSVGLGAGWSLSDAIFGSMKENIQCISHKIPSHQMDIKPEILKQLDSVEPIESDEYYVAKFDELSPDELNQKFLYLNKNNIKSISIVVNDSINKDNLLSVIKDISEDLSIELIICFIPSIIDELPGSVIRILGKGAFPHIKTDELNPYDYTINGINKLPETKIPNKGKMVPFN